MKTPILPGGRVYLDNKEEEYRQDAATKGTQASTLSGQVTELQEQISVLQGKINTYTAAIQTLETALGDELPDGYTSPLPTT